MPLKTRPRGICVHCRRDGELTWDHVPPRGMFPAVAPSQLIKVPSCLECNNGASDDDENFRTVVSFRNHAAEHAVGRLAAQRSLRGIVRPERRRNFDKLYRSLVPATLVSPAGIWIERGHAFTADFRRIDAVVSRITTGLFWLETRRVLRPSYTVRTVPLENMLNNDQGATLKALGSFASCPMRSNADGAFRYRFTRESSDEDFTTWWMEFYEDASFIAVTIDPNEWDARRAGLSG